MLAVLSFWLCACDSKPTQISNEANENKDDEKTARLSDSSTENKNWQLVWQDEFDAPDIDPNKWTFQVNCAGGGNNELQCYTSDKKNAFVEQGNLNIRALKEKSSGFDGWDGHSGNQVEREYSSARIHSRYRGDWQYGRIEVRAKLPQGQGIWPAIWMMPTDEVYGPWPLSGEIDIVEAVNLGAGGDTDNVIVQTLHFGDAAPNNKMLANNYRPEFKITADFHIYSLEWEQGEIRWYLDGKLISIQKQADWHTNGKPAVSYPSTSAKPFDQAFYLIMNVAVGGNWPGAPDDNTVFPQTLLIDYVRVYQSGEESISGG